jgi:hypothetical protein
MCSATRRNSGMGPLFAVLMSAILTAAPCVVRYASETREVKLAKGKTFV